MHQRPDVAQTKKNPNFETISFCYHSIRVVYGTPNTNYRL